MNNEFGRMKVLYLVIFILLGIFSLYSEDGSDPEGYGKMLAELTEEVGADNVEMVLSRMRMETPEDPDAWILSANYFFRKSQTGGVVIGPPGMMLQHGVGVGGLGPDAKKGVDSIYNISMIDGKPWLINPDNGRPIGPLEQPTHYDSKIFKEGLKMLVTAREKFPERMDIHFGLAAAFLMINNFEGQLDALDRMVSDYIKNFGNLKWSHGVDLSKKGDQVVVGALQKIAMDHFHRETEEGDEALLRVARLIVKVEPRDPRGWNDLAIYYGVNNQWIEMHKVLKEANRCAPDDHIVLYNLVNNAFRLGLDDDAISYFQALERVKNDIDEEKMEKLRVRVSQLSGRREGDGAQK